MKNPLITASLLLPFLAGWFCLCLAFPKTVTGAFETLVIILLFLGAGASVLGPILAGLAAVFSSNPPPDPPSAPLPRPQGPSPRSQITPLLLGLVLGWWIGGGPDDNGDGC